MPTIEQNKAYLEDSSRFPKRQVNPLLQPHFQHSSEEYNRIIEYLAQLYERTCQAVTQVDGVLDTLSTNPIQNAVVAARFSEIDVRLLRCRVAFFQDIIASGSDRQVSIPTDGTPSEVFFFEAQSTFGLVPGGSAVSGSQYYNNWGRRAIYIDDLLQPFDDKLYFCIEERKLYVWDGEELVSVGGDKITIDTALSSTSANPVQNKAVTAELNRLQEEIDEVNTPTMRHFEVDDDGNLIEIRSGSDDDTSFEIDADGNFIRIINNSINGNIIMSERINHGRIRPAHTGPYNSTTDYIPMDVAEFEGSSYWCTKPCRGVPPTDTTYWRLMSKKGVDGTNGNDGMDGLDAYQPFKGWFNSASDLNTTFASPQVGDYAYVVGASASDPVTIYRCTTAGTWAASTSTFNPANNQEFASGEGLNTVHIVDNLTSSSPTDVLSAKQGNVLDVKLNQLDQKIDQKNSDMIVTTQNGFFVVDSLKRIGLQYTNNGLDVAKITDHFKSLLGGGGGSVDEDEVREIVEEILANAGIELVPGIVKMAKGDDYVHLAEHWSDVTFGLLTDIHGAGTELKAFVDFCNYYSVPYMFHLGDSVVDKYSDGVAFWSAVEGSNKVLNTIGNHDSRYGSTGSNWWYYANKQQCYDTFIKPFIQQSISGVVQPSDAASTYKCYYYVDLYKNNTATSIRVIVLDSMSWYNNAAGAAQYSWLNDVLTASRTAGKHVLICTHIPINNIDEEPNCPFNNSSISPGASCIDVTLAGESSYLDRYITPSSSNVPNAMTLSNLVESHITQGLIFVAYMCGHTHANYLGTIKNHPNQLQIVLPTGRDFSSPVFDNDIIYKYCFSLCGINTESKRLMLYRFGKTTQRWGFDTRSFSYNYETHKIVQINGKLTFN